MRNRLPLKRRQILLLSLLLSIGSAALFGLFSAYEQCNQRCLTFNADLCASAPAGLLGGGGGGGGVGFASALPTDRFSQLAQARSQPSRIHGRNQVARNRINERREERETDKTANYDNDHEKDNDNRLVLLDAERQRQRNVYDEDHPAELAEFETELDVTSVGNEAVRGLRNIDCVINDEYSVSCLGDLRKRQVFVPFSFIERYFEVGGRLDVTNGRFEWSHSGITSSGSTLVRAFSRYSVHGAFMNFASYNVEARERVLCVTADGVPFSTQWNARGHFYPVQIAQFGLSHFSRLFTDSALDSSPSCVQLPALFDVANWRIVNNKQSSITSFKVSAGVLQFEAAGSQLTADFVAAPDPMVREMIFDYKFTSDLLPGFNFTLLLNASFVSNVNLNPNLDSTDQRVWHVPVVLTYYVMHPTKPQNRFVRVAHSEHGTANSSTIFITYFINSQREFTVLKEKDKWHVFARNVLVDVKKATAILAKHGQVTISSEEWLFESENESIPPAKLHTHSTSSDPSSNLVVNLTSSKLSRVLLHSVTVSGVFSLREVQLCDGSAKASGEMFMSAVRWFVSRQSAKGGWPVTVPRKFPFETLDAPWHSAMAHGQALSLLVRGYFHSNDERYLRTAIRCVSLFAKRREDGGFRASFMDKFVWYEEYPTANATFVLNGFIYSLLGLFDLREALRAVSANVQLRKENDRHPSSSFEAAALADHLQTVSGYYEEGLVALKALLPLFDSGSGSFYDLRHVTMPTLPPNVARWDYHTTHINQLNVLYTIEQYEPFKRVAERWTEYMKGKRAPHN